MKNIRIRGLSTGDILKRLLQMWPGLLYLLWFAFLEKAIPESGKYVDMHCFIDDIVPFNRFFVVPYFAWFPLMAVFFIWFLFENKEDFLKMRSFVLGGMILCLCICTIIPNGQHLRPDISLIPNDFFGNVVKNLYKTDTCTNVCPSVHVYNSVAGCICVCESKTFSKKKAVKLFAVLAATLISLSTMFLKQHSAVDVICALALCSVVYILVYKTNTFGVHSKQDKTVPVFDKE